MQDINCISLLVLALLFNSGIYKCSKRNTTDKQNSSIFFCTLFMRQRVSGKFIFASVFQGILWGPLKKSIALFLPQCHFRSKLWGLLTRKVIIINSFDYNIAEICRALSTTLQVKYAAMAKLGEMQNRKIQMLLG